MKLPIALALMFFLAGVHSQDAEAEEGNNNIVKIAKKCEDEKKPNPEALEKIDQGQNVDDKSVKDYLVCLLDKAGLLDKDGHLVEDIIEERLLELGMTPDAVPLLEEQCDKEGKDKEETALKFSICIVRAFNSIEKFLEEELQELDKPDSNKE